MDNSDDQYGGHTPSHHHHDSIKRIKKILSDSAREAFGEPQRDVSDSPTSNTVDTGPRQPTQDAIDSLHSHPIYSSQNNPLPPAHYQTHYAQQPNQNVVSPSTQMSSQQKENQKPYKKRMSAEEKQRLVLYYMNAYYQSCINPSGNIMLMETRSGMLYPPGAEEISQAVNAACYYQAGIEVSNSAIRSALAKFTERSSVPLSIRPVYGRAGFLEGSPSSRVINSHHGAYRTESVSPQVALWPASPLIPYVVPHRSLPLEVRSHHIQCTPHKLAVFMKSNTGLSETSLLLVMTWMILTWMPDKKQVLLELRGGDNNHVLQVQRIIKQLIDPSRQPGDNDLPTGTAAFDAFCQQEYVISLERFEKLTPGQQKNLVSVMEGREVEWVWRDGKKQKIRINVQCPVMISCLESPLTDTMLMARTVSIDTNHGQSSEIDVLSEYMQTGMLIDLLALFGLVQQSVDQPVSPEKTERYRRQGLLSDFCRIGELVAINLGRSEEDFWKQLDYAQSIGQEDAFESDDIAQLLVRCWEDNASEAIEFSMTDWLHLLPTYLEEDQEDGFPTSQKALSIRFKKASEVLKSYGLLLESTGRMGSDRRAWRLRKMPGRDTGGFL